MWELELKPHDMNSDFSAAFFQATCQHSLFLPLFLSSSLFRSIPLCFVSFYSSSSNSISQLIPLLLTQWYNSHSEIALDIPPVVVPRQPKFSIPEILNNPLRSIVAVWLNAIQFRMCVNSIPGLSRAVWMERVSERAMCAIFYRKVDCSMKHQITLYCIFYSNYNIQIFEEQTKIRRCIVHFNRYQNLTIVFIYGI